MGGLRLTATTHSQLRAVQQSTSIWRNGLTAAIQPLISVLGQAYIKIGKDGSEEVRLRIVCLGLNESTGILEPIICPAR